MKRRLLNSTALSTALLGKTPESMPAVKLSPAFSGNCLVVVSSEGMVVPLSNWNLATA